MVSQYNRIFFSQNLHEKSVQFPKEKDAFVLDHQHGRRDITCKPVLNKNQSCQLSRIIWETPDFGPYLLVSRLESCVSQIIAKVAISCRLNFPTIKFQIFCVV